MKLYIAVLLATLALAAANDQAEFEAFVSKFGKVNWSYKHE